MCRRGFGEALGLQVLRHGIGRCQADHPQSRPLVRRAHRLQDVALPRPCPALDDLQPTTADRMIERLALIRP